jgi:hypothetical protein
MDHRYIDEHDIVSRHLMGKLSPRDRAEFEEHSLDCPQCLDLLETEEEFRRALKQAAAEDAGGIRNAVPAGLTGWLAGLGIWRQAALWTTAGLLLAMAPTAVYIGRAERARRGVDQGAAASREWQRRYEFERQAGADVRKRLQEAEKKLQQQSAASGERAGSPELPAVASVFTLDAARSADLGISAPLNRIEIRDSLRWIILSVERGDEPEFEDYRATIEDSQGRTLWRKSGIRPATSGTLSLAFDSTFFHEGDFVLRLEALTRGAHYAPAARYLFRVTLRP